MSVLPFPHDRTEVGRVIEAMERRLPADDLKRVQELCAEWKCDLVDGIVAIVGAYVEAERSETARDARATARTFTLNQSDSLALVDQGMPLSEHVALFGKGE